MGANTFTSITPKILAPIVETVSHTKTTKRKLTASPKTETVSNGTPSAGSSGPQNS